MSLVEKEFEQQWNEGKAAEDEEKKQQDEQDASRRPVVRRDYWFDEALNVAIDYMRSLGVGTLAVSQASDGGGVAPPSVPR